jgi:hypothetical protein
MPTKINKLAATTAVAAVLSMLATPAAAVDLPRPAAVDVYDGDALNAERHRRWRRDRNDIDAGDVVAGVVILGAIAAIAGAGRNRDRNRYEGPYPRRDDDYGYRQPGEYQRTDGRGIDRAVDMCVGEVERGADRVGTVDNASRSADGWHVSGQLEDGAPYSCTIGNDGRVGDVSVGDRGAAYAPAEDNQWSDADYAKARANQGYAEPGIDEDLGDDRYETAQAPDFE